MVATLRADCPRCGTEHVTFDVKGSNKVGTDGTDWCHIFEAFSVCRHCKKGTIFVIRLQEYAISSAVLRSEYWINAHLNDGFRVSGIISLKDRVQNTPPEHVPDEIAQIYREGSACASIECFNAAATMYRLCLDLVTKPMLPDEDADGLVPQPSRHQRWNLKPRIEWLLEHGKLPRDLSDLLDNLREDGNDGAHAGTLGQADVDDVADFTNLLLQRIYTDPVRLRIATERREARRASAQGKGDARGRA